MPRPTRLYSEQHAIGARDALYVMQAKDGRIKIGRSHCPARRLQQIECASGTTLRLVAEFAGRGSEERRVLEAAHKFRLVGEWFIGTIEAYETINAAIGARIGFEGASEDDCDGDPIVEAIRAYVRRTAKPAKRARS